MIINWTTETDAGYPVEVARIGAFEATLTEAGAATVGMNVWVGTLAGRVCAISASREKAEKAIVAALKSAVLRTGREIGEEWRSH